MDGVLLRAIEARLEGDESLSVVQKLLVLAACEGEGQLEGALDPGVTVEPSFRGGVAPPPLPAQAGAYLRSIEVRGFRGVGPATRLTLEPGPGLTLVVGRNGSGKSSFAEALEVLFTGENKRWSDRSSVWKEDWRNLHHAGPVTIETELIVEGDARRVTARRTWTKDVTIDGGIAEVQRSGEAPGPLSALGWEQPLLSYRPFLSYNELGSMLDDGPSRLFDAMSQILGLEDIVAAERRLAGERKLREAGHKRAKERLAPLIAQLDVLDDDRARLCHDALSKRVWDLDAVGDVLFAYGEQQECESRGHHLRQLAALQAPARIDAVDALIRELRDAAAGVAAVAGTNASAARDTASLLEAALAFHERHEAEDCPVCGTPSVLSGGWAEQCRIRALSLREQATEADQVHHRERDARASALRVLFPAPDCLQRAPDADVDVSTAMERWTRWSSPADRESLEAIAAHIESTFVEVCDAVEQLRAAALAQLEQRETAWRPVARNLEVWLSDARAATAGAAQVRDLKTAEKWLKDAAADLRDERFRPIADEACRIWGHLRTRSSVDLIRVALEGAGNRRRVEVDVCVDGVAGAALGVMSQGELHSLALSLFLPRATSPESPFRFVVIDDPVQSMDPSRVDGLARVLDEVARRRQVVVFTHDDRLPSAVRDLGIGARVIEVTRRATSVIELRQARDPVARYLDDARAVAATDGLPATVARTLVPGFCREALEAACTESVRRRWLSAGRAHDEVEAGLARAKSLTELTALCLFDNAERGGDVLPWINRRLKHSAGDVYQRCNKGSHHGYEGDLRALVHGAAELAEELRSRP